MGYDGIVKNYGEVVLQEGNKGKLDIGVKTTLISDADITINGTDDYGIVVGGTLINTGKITINDTSNIGVYISSIGVLKNQGGIFNNVTSSSRKFGVENKGELIKCRSQRMAPYPIYGAGVYSGDEPKGNAIEKGDDDKGIKCHIF